MEVTDVITITSDQFRFVSAVEGLAVIPARGAVQHYRTHRTLVDIPRGTTQLERFGAPYCQIHRHDLQQALVAAVLSADRTSLQLSGKPEDFVHKRPRRRQGPFA